MTPIAPASATTSDNNTTITINALNAFLDFAIATTFFIVNSIALLRICSKSFLQKHPFPGKLDIGEKVGAMKRIVLILMMIALIAPTAFEEDVAEGGNVNVTRTKYGDTERYSDSGTVRTTGNRRYASDGTVYTTVGNKVFGSDGSVATSYGDKTYTTGPGLSTTIATKSGDTTYYSGDVYGTMQETSDKTRATYNLYYPVTPSSGSGSGGQNETSPYSSRYKSTPTKPSQGVQDLYRMK